MHPPAETAVASAAAAPPLVPTAPAVGGVPVVVRSAPRPGCPIRQWCPASDAEAVIALASIHHGMHCQALWPALLR
jgi:hypothetical protein